MKTETNPILDQPREELINELRSLVTKTEELLGATVGQVTGEDLATLRSRFDEAQKRLASIYQTAKEKTVAGVKKTNQAVHAHPYETAALAMGVGVLLGILLDRKAKTATPPPTP